MTITECTRQDCLALPYVATTERKAEMFADALEVLVSPLVKAEVFEDGGRWGVAVVEGMEHIGNPDENESVLSAFTLLLCFDLADSTGDMEAIGDTAEQLTANQRAMTRHARRSFRIEDKLNHIIARLDNLSAASAKEAAPSEREGYHA